MRHENFSPVQYHDYLCSQAGLCFELGFFILASGSRWDGGNAAGQIRVSHLPLL